MVSDGQIAANRCLLTQNRMNRRKADFKFLYKYLEDDL